MSSILKKILTQSLRFFQTLEASPAYQDFVRGFFPYQGARVLHFSCLKAPLFDAITLHCFDAPSNTRALVSLEMLPTPCAQTLNALFQRVPFSFEGRVDTVAGYAWPLQNINALVCTPTGPYPRFRFYDIDHDDALTTIAKMLNPWPFDTLSWKLTPLASAHECLSYAHIHPELPSLLQSLEPMVFRGYTFYASDIGVVLTVQNQGGEETLLDVF